MSVSTVSFQPRLVQNFCNFVTKSCTTAQFTNANKLLLIRYSIKFFLFSKNYSFRYLLKQFHVFCQFSTGDPEVDNWKLDLMASAPFRFSLYDFFKSSVTQVPTTIVFRDITSWFTTLNFFLVMLNNFSVLAYLLPSLALSQHVKSVGFRSSGQISSVL